MRQKVCAVKILFLFFLFFTHSCQESPERKPLLKLFKKKEKRLSEKEIAKKAAILEDYFCNLQERRGFNGVVLVAKGTQIILKKPFGYKNFRTKEPLAVDAVFQLASVSKQFTSAAIMLLQQRGLLNYEDSVQKFFPDFPYKGITVHQLLTHQSGLTNYAYFCDKVWDRKKTISNENVLCLMTMHKPIPYYQPGVRYDYSNTGYMLLASIVEKVSKMKFEDFVRHNIFLPARMFNSYVYNHGVPIEISNVVEGYNGGRRRKAGKTYLDGVLGDKGVYSTVEDLYKWDRALYSELVLCDTTLETAFTPVFKKRKKRDNYGYGWRIKDYHGDKVVWHSGWWEGYKTIFLRNLKDETVIIVLTNSLIGHLKSNVLLDAYYEKRIDENQEEDAD
ncbi:MAG TPA: serine hydrolase domain-containing protein [Cytophagales bacterium]|nr:serine hydrolase domain-containing protein [Cytophagales bacterium]